MQIVGYEQVEEKIIRIHDQQVIIDSDVAELYGLETKRVNEAVSRNPDKFPKGYLIQLTASEWEEVKSQIATSPTPLGGGKVRPPKAFTERGLYMLATILKSSRATETTLAIIDTFTKVREAGRIIKQLPTIPENSPKQRELLEKTGDLISDLVIHDNLEPTEAEASIEVNLAVVKFKYTLKKKLKK